MATLAQSVKNYSKFIGFILKYYNTDIFKKVSDEATANTAAEQAAPASEDEYNKPEELVEDLKKLGPTFVKLGQLLSTRPDFLPDDYLEALATLQDDVESIPYADIEKIVESELGVRMSAAFASFDTEPLASASIGQVHKAVLRSGREVAVKIQRPGIRKKFLEDLSSLKEMTALAVKHSKTARKYSIDSILDEMQHILLNELDYIREAQSLQIIGENLQKFRLLLVPAPVMDYTTSRVLTMDFVDGKKVTKITPYERMEHNYGPVVDDFVKAYLKQVIVDGFAHADPHPGNVNITRDHKIALMDMGMVARFSPLMQDKLMALVLAIGMKNGDEITDTLLDISKYNPAQADLDAFRKKVNRLAMDAQSTSANDLQMGKLIMKMTRIAADEEIKIAPEINILGKILLNMDQIVAVLKPDYNLQQAIKDYAGKMMQAKLRQELLPENILSNLVELKKLGKHLPERLNKITENLARNEFSMKIEAIDEKRFTDGFQKVANRITLGLIITGMIIGAAMMMRIPTRFTILGYPGIAMIFFLAAAVSSLLLAYNIIFSDENFKKKKK
ncbi:ABC1 kinase family protein [Haoranjiania flava]|uniref:AarF/UbiB family protein n=1 Tax=Haoranjiania flava TaxID=1856322 RepID=A0AAE3LJ32_9BACT|nr:AarF/UbiB family protein [Haoranjiania flava]MCU7693014.1 AarF/UbiB family protein [Haoranjiania flava]